MRRRPSSRRIWLGPSVSSTGAKAPSGTRPAGVSTSMSNSAPVVRSASARRSTTSKRRLLVDDLRHDAPVGEQLQRLARRRRRQAELGGAIVVDAHLQLRDAHLLLDLQIDDALDRRQTLLQVRCESAQRVEIVAVDLDHELRAHAREHVVEPMRDGLADGDAHRQRREARANVGEHLLAAAAGGLQVDVEFADVHAFGMLVELGPAGAAADGMRPRAPP